jgi:hypothetical protein
MSLIKYVGTKKAGGLSGRTKYLGSSQEQTIEVGMYLCKLKSDCELGRSDDEEDNIH